MCLASKAVKRAAFVVNAQTRVPIVVEDSADRHPTAGVEVQLAKNRPVVILDGRQPVMIQAMFAFQGTTQGILGLQFA